MKVTVEEITELLFASSELVLVNRNALASLAERIKANGIAPPDGYALVPVEPTKAMLLAAHKSVLNVFDLGKGYTAIYKAMLSAVKESK